MLGLIHASYLEITNFFVGNNEFGALPLNKKGLLNMKLNNSFVVLSEQVFFEVPNLGKMGNSILKIIV